MKPLCKAEVMLTGPCYIGCHWQQGAKKSLSCVADSGHRGSPRSCWALLAPWHPAAHESMAPVRATQVFLSGTSPVSCGFSTASCWFRWVLPGGKGQLCSPLCRQTCPESFSWWGLWLLSDPGGLKLTSVGSTWCMAALLCFQKLSYTLFSILSTFGLTKQLVLLKFRQEAEQLSLRLLAETQHCMHQPLTGNKACKKSWKQCWTPRHNIMRYICK